MNYIINLYGKINKKNLLIHESNVLILIFNYSFFLDLFFTLNIVGSLVNAKVMVFLKDKYDGKKLFFRCIFSTIVGGSLDAIIFIFIAFYGTIPLYALLIMLIGQILFKPIYETLTYPITKYIINYIKSLPYY